MFNENDLIENRCSLALYRHWRYTRYMFWDRLWRSKFEPAIRIVFVVLGEDFGFDVVERVLQMRVESVSLSQKTDQTIKRQR